MRVLILGGNGMLGHQLFLFLRQSHEVKVTLRQSPHHYQHYGIFNQKNSFFNINLTQSIQLRSVFFEFKPHIVINAAAIIKQKMSHHKPIDIFEMNAFFPHKLALLCLEYHAKLIQISTDCVFSGSKGQYVETDFSDADDLYGKTKYLGEAITENALTLRTSLIGLELSSTVGLIEWYLSMKGEINGFKRAIFSGFTTYTMANIIHFILTEHSALSGVWHISSHPISKYDLLSQLTALLKRTDIQINKNEDFICDRSLNSDKFYQATHYAVPSWEVMLGQLAEQIKERMCLPCVN